MEHNMHQGKLTSQEDESILNQKKLCQAENKYPQKTKAYITHYIMLKKLIQFVSAYLKILITAMLLLIQTNCFEMDKDNVFFLSFPDDHTLALWLFDEDEYNYTTLCDAGAYHYDLRLMPQGSLSPGKFGNSLTMSGSSGHSVAYAGFAGKVVNNHIRLPDGQISGLWGPTEGPAELLNVLAGSDWTFECWMRLDSLKEQNVLFEMGQGYDPGFSVTLNDSGQFILNAAYSGVAARIIPGQSISHTHDWRHLAFSLTESTIRVFIDGKEQSNIQIHSIQKQPLPDIQKPENREHEHRDFGTMSYDERRRHRFNLTIGHARSGGIIMAGAIDEIRFSDTSLYANDFEPPASFARKSGAYGARISKPVSPARLPLLFENVESGKPLQFGLRKYVFIDDAIIDTSCGVKIMMNQPVLRQEIDFKPRKSAWRPTVVDVDNKVHLYVPEGYDSELGRTFLYTSLDGIHFTEHKNSPVITNLPLYGTFFEDKNPNILREEKYKLTSWIANRGIHLFFSPDGINWRRNETLILPLVSGGSAESYYDDQQGRYVLFIRRDTSFRTSTCPGGARQCILFETQEPAKTWPFKHLEQPYYEGWTLPAVTCEGPVIFDETESGQAYRSRVIKYPWAPDVYLAFVWRFPSDQGDDPARHVDLGVSRNGKQWKFFEPTQGWYIPIKDDHDAEQLSLYGLILRGNEIWQYTDHGGPHGGSPPRTYYRWKQRLDGFTSLDGSGSAVTRPVIFYDSNVRLILNSTGIIKVAVVDEDGKEFPEFSISKCDSVSDSVSNLISWSGKSDLSLFSGVPIRLRFEFTGAKLYAFELKRL